MNPARSKGLNKSGMPRRQNIRFGVNKGRKNPNLCIDEHIQEATPEHLRIEIDNIFREFLDDSEKTEYIFPTDLNNLQRKYIHYKAQIMNLSSKSHGKEPNRQLHLKKLPKQIASQSIQVYPCDEIMQVLEDFKKKYDSLELQPENPRSVKRFEKVYGRLQDSDPLVPKLGHVDKEIQIARKNLPIFEKRQEVLDTIDHNQVVIISSETGSGKTTQIPQYIMEDCVYKNKPCKIVCTQPRRISTLAAAERVAYERGEKVGGSVGYHIRLESNCGHHTNLLYCTVGVFLRNLMCGNKCLKYITHVIVDEIHERDKLSDFLLICLRQNLVLAPHIKIILMSATVDTSKFQQYFKTSAVLSIPGRLYPIQAYFLEDILSMTKFFTPQMRVAMNKCQQKQISGNNSEDSKKEELSEDDQRNFNYVLETYMNYSGNYDYTLHYDEATADLLQLFISENVSVDQKHSEKGWTALMVASHLGDMEFVSKLCTMGAKLEISDDLGRTAYDYARAANKMNVLKLLDYVKEQNINEKSSDTNDNQYLKQLYDMTTPDDFIDYDLIVALIKFIHVNCDSGSILVFLPGYDEIMQCNDHIVDSDINSSSYRIFFLHSSMNMKDQCDVFKKLPYQRKIILSTNIAETSITIEDVVFVIDIGKAKEKVYDSYNKLSALQTQWISRACAKQREGRAGRVRPGCCFKLYSNQRHTHMADERVPEILRVSLEELCLNAKIIAHNTMNIYNFLSLAPDPPTSNSISAAIENLQSLGALDKEEELTKLGEYLAQLTLEPRLGKMLIYGCIFKCLEPMLTMAAAMAHKDPFQLPPQANLKVAAAAKRRELIGSVMSDHIVYLKVFERWQNETANGNAKKFCHEYFISESTMFSVLETRRQLLGQLRAVGFVNNAHSLDEYNVNNNSWGLVKAIMGAALFPNVAFPTKKGLVLSTKSEKKVAVHNTSACSAKKYQYWCFYDEMVKNKANFMVRGVTLFTELPVALMCGVNALCTSSHSINVDNWLEFYFGDPVILKFRFAIHDLVNRSMINPWHSFDHLNKVVTETLTKIMDLEEKHSDLVVPENIGAKPKFLHKVLRANEYKKKQYNNYENPQTNNIGRNRNDWMEYHKQGRTPKRFIPPNMKYTPQASNAARNLNFDYSGNTNNYHVMQNFQNIALDHEEGSPSAATALLRGLQVYDDEAGSSVGCYDNRGSVPVHKNNGRYRVSRRKK